MVVVLHANHLHRCPGQGMERLEEMGIGMETGMGMGVTGR